jgi:hypothetical protein
MAYLFNQLGNTRCYLYAHHSFGRFSYSVDTVISHPCVSKIHAIVEWKNQQWCIRDISTNGTWLNNKKLIKEQHQPLKVGDIINIVNGDNYTFEVHDLSPPCDLLVPHSSSISYLDEIEQNAISLQSYHLLPNEKKPEVALRLDLQSKQWLLEYIDEPNIKPRLLNEGDVITLNHQNWQLQHSRLEDSTELQNKPLLAIDDLFCLFELSPNEEITKLKVISPHDVTNFHTRSHHYLTLTLARYRAEDAKKGLPCEEQGWVNTERLLRDLGVDMAHLNIQIHRSRKQFADMLTNVINAENVIERQLRQVRFACPAFEIHKGHKLECSLDLAHALKPQSSDLAKSYLIRQ